MHAHQQFFPTPTELIGETRRFGETGPVYLIRAVGQELANGDVMMTVLIASTGEVVDLRYSHILRDPLER